MDSHQLTTRPRVVAQFSGFCDTTPKAYIVRRTTRAGQLCTALVESYRDEQGRPRRRLLTNLHGEPSLLKALAKLTNRRDLWRKNRDENLAECDAHERGWIKDRWEERLTKIEQELAVIKRHCDATPAQIKAAIEAYRDEEEHATAEVLGRIFSIGRDETQLRKAKSALRRLRK